MRQWERPVGGDWIDRLAAGGKYTGVGLVAYTGFRLLVFTCDFFAGRYDTRQSRLEARELRLEASLGNRLAHLERQQTEDRAQIRTLEGWIAVLASELRQTDPNNPQLAQLARSLRGVAPIVPPDPMLEEIMRHAGSAIDKDPKP